MPTHVRHTSDEPRKGRLVFCCGKMAAGKSMLAKQLAENDGAVLLAQDEFLVRLGGWGSGDLGGSGR